MARYVDPSEQTPLFTAQQVTCAYPISDYYASLPRYLYYALLIACLSLRWHPWLGEAFLGAAATYAGVAAIEAFILLAGYPKPREMETISIPFVSSASVPGNDTLSNLSNLVVDSSVLSVKPAVMEFDIDGILAIVVTGYLFMLPVHCWSSSVRGHRARHFVMALWNALMLCGTICALTMWLRLDDVPYQFRFCYPGYPDGTSVQSDGWQSTLWRGNWNETIWNTFADPAVANILADNCFYPCFNTSQVLRRQESITADIRVLDSPRTNINITPRQVKHQSHLVFFVYAAISLSAFTAVLLFILTAAGLHKYTVVPIHQPFLLWTERKRIRATIMEDIRNLFQHRKHKKLVKSEKEAEAETESGASTPTAVGERRRKSLLRVLTHLTAFTIVFIVLVIIPATWIAFICWIEWWIHRDLVSSETPRQVGQWAPAVSIGLVLVSALVLRLKYHIATREEIGEEIDELKKKIRKLKELQEKKL